jgi:hypothetical protein
MLTWLDYSCRRAISLADAKHAKDPREVFAIYLWQRLSHEHKQSVPYGDILEEASHVMLMPFFQGFLPASASWIMADGTEPPRPLGLVLTRDTANLLSAAGCSNISDAAWRSELDFRQVVYVDVPHGAILLDVGAEARDVLQLRAIFAAPFLPEGMPGHTLFIAHLTEKGSEQGRGRIAGVLHPDGRISSFGSTRTGRTAADPPLRPPFVHPLADKTVLGRAGTFLRLVLAYHFFGPQSAREPIAATPGDKLRSGKPRKEESLFALTRLHASSEVGRPKSTIRDSWSLTSRHEVAGHFKLQPYGPRHSLRRLIWVEGYERGPTGAPVKPRAYAI